MIRQLYRVAYRNILKNKLFSFLNILGLAIGLATCFFIFQYIFSKEATSAISRTEDGVTIVARISLNINPGNLHLLTYVNANKDQVILSLSRSR